MGGKMNEWADISTAPINKPILICFADSTITVGMNEGAGNDGTDDWVIHRETLWSEPIVELPTHWMPLPPAPEEKP